MKHKAIEIGKKIKQARNSIGLSQDQLARFVNISDKAISSYEVGRTVPSRKILKKISTIIQKPLSYFDDSPLSKEDLLIALKKIEVELAEVKKMLKKVD